MGPDELEEGCKITKAVLDRCASNGPASLGFECTNCLRHSRVTIADKVSYSSQLNAIMLDAKTNLPSSRIILLHRTEYRIEPFALPDGLHSAEIV
jgi:hypothetical protein